MRRAALLLAGAAGFVALVAILALVVRPGGGAATEQVTGVVVKVDSHGLADVRGFTIRTNDGREIQFTLGLLENGAQFAPGHLVEHAATASPVRVTYHTEAGVLIATRLEDAP